MIAHDSLMAQNGNVDAVKDNTISASDNTLTAWHDAMQLNILKGNN